MTQTFEGFFLGTLFSSQKIQLKKGTDIRRTGKFSRSRVKRRGLHFPLCKRKLRPFASRFLKPEAEALQAVGISRMSTAYVPPSNAMLDAFIRGNMTALENKLMAMMNSGQPSAKTLAADMDMGYVVICAAMVLFMQVRHPLLHAAALHSTNAASHWTIFIGFTHVLTSPWLAGMKHSPRDYFSECGHMLSNDDFFLHSTQIPRPPHCALLQVRSPRTYRPLMLPRIHAGWFCSYRSGSCKPKERVERGPQGELQNEGIAYAHSLSPCHLIIPSHVVAVRKPRFKLLGGVTRCLAS
jgi:hypothetical protein